MGIDVRQVVVSLRLLKKEGCSCSPWCISNICIRVEQSLCHRLVLQRAVSSLLFQRSKRASSPVKANQLQQQLHSRNE